MISDEPSRNFVIQKYPDATVSWLCDKKEDIPKEIKKLNHIKTHYYLSLMILRMKRSLRNSMFLEFVIKYTVFKLQSDIKN